MDIFTIFKVRLSLFFQLDFHRLLDTTLFLTNLHSKWLARFMQPYFIICFKFS